MSTTSASPVPEIADFAAEARALAGLLNGLEPADWTLRTQFKDWSVNDVVLHLFASDAAAILAATDEAAFRVVRADMIEQRAQGLTMIEECRRRYPSLRGDELGRIWIEQALGLADLLGSLPAGIRLPWSGPDLGLRMFVTARQMETWAHGQEIHDVLGRERRAEDRIRNIATLGVRTFGWSFSNRGLPVPTDPPAVRLAGPGGDVWRWNEGSERSAIEGDAVDFCQVVTQVRNIADTCLSVAGEAATRWVAIAQCFAGPPSDPPRPGTRFREHRTRPLAPQPAGAAT